MLIAVIFITFKSTCALEFFWGDGGGKGGGGYFTAFKDELQTTMIILSLYLSR